MLITLCIFICLLVYLHFFLIPEATGSYSYACYPDKTRRENLKHLALSVIGALEDLKETYWLDFGSLLGASRIGGIMLHDEDIDLSRLVHKTEAEEKTYVKSMQERLAPLGVKGNLTHWWYKGEMLDIFRHKISDDNKYIVPKVDKASKMTFVKRLRGFTSVVQYPIEDILPLGKLKFIDDNMASVPRDYKLMLRRRYPFTYWFTFPYKWRCWF